MSLSIGNRIQIAIAANVVLAIVVGEYLISASLGFSGTQGVLVNLLLNGSIAFVYGLFVSRVITSSLRAQLDMLKTISSGGGDLTQRLACDTQDEVGELSVSFNVLIEHLHGIISRVAGVTQGMSASVRFFQQSGRDITQGVHQQVQETNRIVEQIEAMSENIKQIEASTHHASGLAIESKAGAEQGVDIVAKTTQGMQQVATTVEESASTLSELKLSIDTIGNMVDTINAIAEQTNLLALNAAIEAARAGENGRGFAVVADEVRALSIRTADATNDVGGLISAIQHSLERMIALMHAGTLQVEAGVSLSDDAGIALGAIVERSQRVAAMVNEISTAVEEQTAITKKINIDVQSVAQVAQQNGGSVEQVVSFAADLEVQSKNLGSIINEFKL